MTADPLKVLIVDDSRIFRGVIEEALAGRNDVRVMGSVWCGEKAIEAAQASLPDFVTLDVEMPGMGGIETLKTLRSLAIAQKHSLGVVLISSHTQRGAAITVEGLQEGAFDFIPKPSGPDSRVNASGLREQLLAKIDAWQSRMGRSTPTRVPVTRTISSARRSTRFQAVVIGASTGGPEALTRILPVLAPLCPVPMFLVQHLPADFSRYFAQSLSKRCGTPIVEVQEGAVAAPGTLYVAPGGKHMLLSRQEGRVIIEFSNTPPENGCRPAVDVLFRSAAAIYGSHALGLVLTGMGSDGARGAAVLKRAGAHIIVQDEATSVVWGMPGSVVAAGAADEMLPLDEIGPTLLHHLGIGD